MSAARRMRPPRTGAAKGRSEMKNLDWISNLRKVVNVWISSVVEIVAKKARRKG